MNASDCAECLRILFRDGVAESCYEECYYCKRVKIILGKRVLNAPHRPQMVQNKDVFDKEVGNNSRLDKRGSKNGHGFGQGED